MRKKEIERLDINKLSEMTKRPLAECKCLDSEFGHMYRYLFNGRYDISAYSLSEVVSSENGATLAPYVLLVVSDIKTNCTILNERINKEDKITISLVLDIGNNLMRSTQFNHNKFRKEML